MIIKLSLVEWSSCFPPPRECIVLQQAFFGKLKTSLTVVTPTGDMPLHSE